MYAFKAENSADTT